MRLKEIHTHIDVKTHRLQTSPNSTDSESAVNMELIYMHTYIIVYLNIHRQLYMDRCTEGYIYTRIDSDAQIVDLSELCRLVEPVNNEPIYIYTHTYVFILYDYINSYT